MKRLVTALAATVAVGALAAGSATAAPSPVNGSVKSQARYVSPTSILLEATITCPVTAGTGFVQGNVFESSTGGTGFGFASMLVCTGSARTVVIPVNGGPFTPGSAYVNFFACAGGFCDNLQRQIQIVL